MKKVKYRERGGRGEDENTTASCKLTLDSGQGDGRVGEVSEMRGKGDGVCWRGEEGRGRKGKAIKIMKRVIVLVVREGEGGEEKGGFEVWNGKGREGNGRQEKVK